VSSYGIAAIDEAKSQGNVKRITGLVEKPKPADAPSTLGIIGKYLIPHSVIGVLNEIEGGQGGEIRLIDALIHRKDHVPIWGVEMQGKRLDTGTPEGYKEAVKILG
jgi:UTP--glucose-1-phosphate uridylyltransferase